MMFEDKTPKPGDEIESTPEAAEIFEDLEPVVEEPEEVEETAASDGEEKTDVSRELFDWAQSLVTALLILSIMFAFFVRLVGVSGGSMEPTLLHNEFLIVSDLFYEPKAGDIVVMTKKTFMEDSFVKRIIATEGQTVYVDYDNGVVYVDGVKLDEPYTKTPTTRRGDVEFPVTVPEGHVFVMGDNRNGSTDSRVSMCGMVDERMILGRVLFRVFPFTRFGVVK